MKPRALLHQSAPSAMARAMSKAVRILPEQPSLMLSSMALQMARNSTGWPRQSLNPTGLPPDRPRNLSMNSIISSGVEKDL
jgi:hypothetical protein